MSSTSAARSGTTFALDNGLLGGAATEQVPSANLGRRSAGRAPHTLAIQLISHYCAHRAPFGGLTKVPTTSERTIG
jgi:hypothetical protein